MSCNFAWISPDALKNISGVSFKVKFKTHPTTSRHVPEDSNPQQNLSDNLKSLSHTFIYNCDFLGTTSVNLFHNHLSSPVIYRGQP